MRVDLARREFRTHGVPVPIGGRAFDIIETLVRAAGRLVTKDDLMDRVWAGAVVEENTLQVHVSAVRKALGPYRSLLKTESGRGYRLLGTWAERNAGIPAGLAEREPRPAANGPANGNVAPFEREPVRSVAEAPRSNFPLAIAALVGRSAAALRLGDLLSAYRVVTLTGPGGIGKTTLALDVTRGQLANFADGGWLVELAFLSDAKLVPSAVAATLGLKVSDAMMSATAVSHAIGGRELLLLLDNCEHVIDAVAELAETIVRLCPRTTVLATSREVLRIDGEHVYRVPPLDVPALGRDEPKHILGHSAVELFVKNLRTMNAEIMPDAADLPAIAEICRHLDGIPLAIEFAAARAATFGIRQVAMGLGDRFALLTSGRRTALPRHQTLRAALDWSYQLLSADEQRLLRYLAIFPAGFTLPAARAVAAPNDSTATAVADGIAGLVGKSLVTRDVAAPDDRWRLLETIRAYALEKLTENGERDAAARRHAEYFRDIILTAGAGTVQHFSVEDVTRYGRDLDNVRTAFDWAFSPGGDVATGVVLTAALAPLWLHSSLVVECYERTERALRALETLRLELSPPLQRRLHLVLGVSLLLTMGSVDRAREVIGKARDIAKELDDIPVLLRILWAQWSVDYTTGDCAAAEATTVRFSAAARRSGDGSTVLVGDRLIANTLQHAGRPRDAQALLERMLDQYVPPKSQFHTILFQYDQRALARAMLARVLWLGGAIDQANDQAQASLAEVQAADPGFSLCWVLHYAICPLALTTGDMTGADYAVTTLLDLSSRLNAALWKIVARCWQGKLLIARSEFSAGTELLSSALASCEETGWLFCYPEFMGMRAEGLLGLGQVDDAVATLDRALARAALSGERWYEPELLRLKGEALLRGAGDQRSAAEECFGEAMRIAAAQGALFWELHAALSLARWQASQARPDEAKQVLAPVYARFTEGFATADLAAAKALLDTLS